MLRSKEKPFPKTSETCEMLLEGIKASVGSPDPWRQADANKKLEMLKQNRCKKALLWVHENYRMHPSPFVQQFAKTALEYAQSL